jgi:hypothetical protein
MPADLCGKWADISLGLPFALQSILAGSAGLPGDEEADSP